MGYCVHYRITDGNAFFSWRFVSGKHLDHGFKSVDGCNVHEIQAGSLRVVDSRFQSVSSVPTGAFCGFCPTEGVVGYESPPDPDVHQGVAIFLVHFSHTKGWPLIPGSFGQLSTHFALTCLKHFQDVLMERCQGRLVHEASGRPGLAGF